MVLYEPPLIVFLLNHLKIDWRITSYWHTTRSKKNFPKQESNHGFTFLIMNVAKKFKEVLLKNTDAVQLVPSHIHRRNAAERTIRTFKDHFIAVLASADPQFPLTLWDRIVPQAEQNLNMIRMSAINNKKSAYEQIHGAFDFNATPLAPPGTRSLVHLKPNQRQT